MAEEKTTTETTTELAADEAERARIAADQAAAAATAATAAAAIEGTKLAEQAEARLKAIEEEATSWRGQREQFEIRAREELSSREAMLARLGKTEADLQSILSKLAPPPEPPPPSPPPDRPPVGATTKPPAEGKAVEPETPPARKRAHRWI